MDHKFNDIRLTSDFINDYENAPHRIRKRMDLLIRLVLDSGRLPNSVRAHRTDSVSNVWIGYASVTREHWRILFSWDENKTLLLLRLVNHNTMDAWLDRMDVYDRKRMVEEYFDSI